MDGYQYEHHCAKLLKQRGFRNVNIIPTLLAIKLFNKRMPEQNFTIAM